MPKTRLLILLSALLSACATRPVPRPIPVEVQVAPPPAPVAPSPAPVIPPHGAGGTTDKIRSRAAVKVLDVWMLDVGQGSCTFIACPDGKSNVVIDCGTKSGNGADPDAIASWINERNSRATNVTLLVSHGHMDHLSHLVPSRLKAEYFTQVLLGGLPIDYPDTFDRWVARAKATPTFFDPGESRVKDERFICGGATFDLLTVNATEVRGVRHVEDKENANSAVVRLSFAGHSIVFPGDAEGPTEQGALANAASLGIKLSDTSLLVSAHHGAETGDSNSAEWLKALKPRAGMFSANVELASYSHPSCSRVGDFYDYVDDTAREFDLTCGQEKTPHTLRVAKRLFNTYDNGHVRARFSKAGVSYACAESTPACDSQLTKEEMP